MTDYRIRFTQYLLPNGRRQPVDFVTQREDVFLKSEEIRRAGFHFECEVLRNGSYSGTIGDEYGDYAHAFVADASSPRCQTETERMILEFDVAAGLRMSEESR